MIVDKLLAIQFSCLILFFTLCVQHFLLRAWSHPAVIFGLFWWVMTFFPLAILADVPISPWGTAYILAAVIAFAAPAVFFDWSPLQRIAQTRINTSSLDQPTTLRSIFYVMQVATILFIAINIRIQGFSILDFILHPIQSGSEYLKMRYDGGIVPNPISRTGVVLNYAAASLGGLIIIGQTRKFHAAAIFLLSFAPSLLHIVIYGDKGTLFLSIAYFYGSLMVGWTSRGNTALFTKGSIKTALAALVVLIPVLVLAMLARGIQSGNVDQIQKVIFYFTSYFFGHIYAFSDWFGHYYQFRASTVLYVDDNGAPTGGFWTFMALGKLISPGHTVPQGYFGEMFEYKDVLATNIYTMFRGLIYDFTLIGSLVFMSGAGLVSSLAYRQMLLFRRARVSQTFYIFLIGFIYSSFLLSSMTWFSVYAVCGIVAVTLFIFA